MPDLLPLLASVVLGTALAASCGLRAFLPLFVLGLAARLGFVDVGDTFAWLAHGPALLALAVGVVLELLGDKVPFINHLLDVLQAPVRTLAGMLICGAVIVDLPPWVIALLAIIVGGGAALAVHATRSALRAGGTAVSAGAATPLLSIAEDVLCLLSTVLSIAIGLVALAVAALAVVLAVVIVRALLRPTRDAATRTR